ncbi:LLM class flavin-dependent oxidoreductase [Amnibacterium flavum]|uniref:LLM class flavin-dependent oxidoreductase n=1 Tax=Amnibacterium flavum TaxID=2173173 RepID=A0A2V1HM83_9MICO|nr:LLM class flavin-dependent oxidoreductase [Amnibacterium flavum]PVZ93565.1 LLM class flavin-dependent oxidoreductase [Amnibacterium flavum]
MSAPLRLSVLDLVPVRADQTSADAIAASLQLASLADRLGYERFWFAEHHNMPSVASTNPPVLIALAAGRTERIRLGSGGVMLPNHAPFVIAEQFAALEAAAPGRIDLGIGRAPGSDPVISALLRSSGHTSDVDTFPSNVNDVLALMDGGGAQLSLRGAAPYVVRATPAAGSVPEVWLLGSSDYSAKLAGQTGLPYVFAHHFSGEGTAAALSLYRREFVPSLYAAEPKTLLTVNAVVADTADEAFALALPQLQQMARLRTGQPLFALPSVEEAQATEMTPAQNEMIDRMRGAWIIDDASGAASRIAALAERFGVDEVMLVPGAGARNGEEKARAISRELTLSLVAGELLSAQGLAAAADVPAR